MKGKLEWVLLAAAVVGAIVFGQLRGGRFKVNQVIEAPITLVPKDRYALSCAYKSAIGPYACEFEAPDKRRSSPPDPKDRLVPYMTSDSIMYLIPGLFEIPAVDARHGEKKRGSRRFTAQCELKLLERVEKVGTRWARDLKWGSAGPAWVAEPIGCTVTETD